jgi:SAM-dependent methyltransferase
MLITEHYRYLNAECHARKKKYGAGEKYDVESLLELCKAMETEDVLDYGCGKATIAISGRIPFKIKLYDPAIPEYYMIPEPADIVMCIAVLEHIEAECLNDVIQDLKRVTKKLGIFMIDLEYDSTILADGQNAHRSVHTEAEWIKKLEPYFNIETCEQFRGVRCILVHVTPKS